MKKVILIAAMALSLTGCLDVAEDKSYQVKMEIHYPSKIDTVTVENKSYLYPELHSHEGTNYIPSFYATTAPIRIISITEIDSTSIK